MESAKQTVLTIPSQERRRCVSILDLMESAKQTQPKNDYSLATPEFQSLI